MRHFNLIVFGTAVLGFAFSPAPQSREARIAALPVDAEAAEETAPTLPGFSGDQLQRLRQLRAWLERRKQERRSGDIIDPIDTDRKPPRPLSASADRQLLTPLGQRYALGFEKNRRNGTEVRVPPTLRIGLGPDGRVRHRYVFRDAEQAEAEPEIASVAAATVSRPPAGTLASRQRIVRVWTPEPLDPRAVPRLEYELPDSRR